MVTTEMNWRMIELYVKISLIDNAEDNTKIWLLILLTLKFDEATRK
jgi:hypothetical protein